MFISKPDHHALNIRQAASYKARPALLTTPTGEQEPAVVLHGSGILQGVLPIPQALRLANEIADALASHRTTKEQE